MEVLSSRILIRPRDPEAAWAFYGGTLGLAVSREFPGGIVYFLGTGYLEVSGGRRPSPSGRTRCGCRSATSRRPRPSSAMPGSR